MITGIDTGDQRLLKVITNQLPRAFILGTHVHPDLLLFEQTYGFLSDTGCDHHGDVPFREPCGQQTGFMRGRCHQRLVLYGSILCFNNCKLLTMAKVLTESSLFDGLQRPRPLPLMAPSPSGPFLLNPGIIFFFYLFCLII